ncbi:hypothetical protein N9174_01200 [bacterium]|nr:hypothetical protein [bacterium]
MRRLSVAVLGMFLILVMAGVVGAGPKPGPGESHVPYEMAVFKPPDGPQGPGTHLNAPGDTYRFTYLINDKYSKDPAYVLKRVTFGIHILDPEYSKASGDGPQEWGRILIDGKPREMIGRAYGNKGAKKGEIKDFMEMASDPEAKGSPPYIYAVTDFVKDGKLVLEVTNLRKDGSIDGDAPFGDFIVLRAGLHLFYVKK